MILIVYISIETLFIKLLALCWEKVKTETLIDIILSVFIDKKEKLDLNAFLKTYFIYQ